MEGDTMDWQRWIRSAKRQIDLVAHSIITAHTGQAAYLLNLRELVAQVEDVHGEDEAPGGEASPGGHGFLPGAVTPTACVYCGLRRIMHDTDESPGFQGDAS
jgi:hypothetical protein